MPGRRLEDREPILLVGPAFHPEPAAADGSTSSVLLENLQRRRAGEARKRMFLEGFVVFVEQLNRAGTEREVFDILLHDGPQLLSVCGVVLLLPGEQNGNQLYPRVSARVTAHLDAVPANAALPNAVPGPITVEDTAPGQPYAALVNLFAVAGASHLASTVIGTRGILVLVERRQQREFSGEDWFHLQVVARHAECTLERLQLRSAVRLPPIPA